MRVSKNSPNAPAAPSKLPLSFYERATKLVARQLLGKILCRKLKGGTVLKARISETEAYEGEKDRAAHTFGGRKTDRVKAMWGPGGHAYVYFIYGMHECMNVVTRKAGRPEAVLLRAADAVEGHEIWAKALPHLKPNEWMKGPGRLCKAMHIDRSFNGISFESDVMWIEDAKALPAARIGVTPRIGVDYAGECARKPLRFFDKNSLSVSGSKSLNSSVLGPSPVRSRRSKK